MHAFERILRRTGETLTLEDSTTQIKASLIASTKATYSLGNRAFYFDGISLVGGAVGDYVTRESDGLSYFISTIQPQPLCKPIQIIFIVQCNACAILSREADDMDENDSAYFMEYAQAVKVYKDTTPRSKKEVNDGLLDQAIYLMHIPHRFGIREMDRVTFCRPDGSLKNYRVDSINDTLTPMDNSVEGVDVVQLTDDKRIGKTRRLTINPRDNR